LHGNDPSLQECGPAATLPLFALGYRKSKICGFDLTGFLGAVGRKFTCIVPGYLLRRPRLPAPAQAKDACIIRRGKISNIFTVNSWLPNTESLKNMIGGTIAFKDKNNLPKGAQGPWGDRKLRAFHPRLIGLPHRTNQIRIQQKSIKRETQVPGRGQPARNFIPSAITRFQRYFDCPLLDKRLFSKKLKG
jgi:hypothetical protein